MAREASVPANGRAPTEYEEAQEAFLEKLRTIEGRALGKGKRRSQTTNSGVEQGFNPPSCIPT